MWFSVILLKSQTFVPLVVKGIFVETLLIGGRKFLIGNKILFREFASGYRLSENASWPFIAKKKKTFLSLRRQKALISPSLEKFCVAGFG